MTRVKVCGITRETDLRAAVAAGTDAVGFVVDVPVDTPREITADRAAELAGATPPFVTTVLVTMPEGDPAATVDLVSRVQPDAVQVHGEVQSGDGQSGDRQSGDGQPGDLAALAEAIPASIVVAGDAEGVGAIADAADAVLLDSQGDRGRGGTGETHDWHRARAVVGDLDVPVVLAGGLTPENVAEAVATVRPHAVDVASGVERDGGLKDHDAVERFVRAARGGERPVMSRERSGEGSDP